MTLQEAYEKRRQEVLSLQRQVKTLQKDLEEVSAGLYTPEEKVAFLNPRLRYRLYFSTFSSENQVIICFL